jgi:hypothetical protein
MAESVSSVRQEMFIHGFCSLEDIQSIRFPFLQKRLPVYTVPPEARKVDCLTVGAIAWFASTLTAFAGMSSEVNILSSIRVQVERKSSLSWKFPETNVQSVIAVSATMLTGSTSSGGQACALFHHAGSTLIADC